MDHPCRPVRRRYRGKQPEDVQPLAESLVQPLAAESLQQQLGQPLAESLQHVQPAEVQPEDASRWANRRVQCFGQRLMCSRERASELKNVTAREKEANTLDRWTMESQGEANWQVGLGRFATWWKKKVWRTSHGQAFSLCGEGRASSYWRSFSNCCALSRCRVLRSH